MNPTLNTDRPTLSEAPSDPQETPAPLTRYRISEDPLVLAAVRNFAECIARYNAATVNGFEAENEPPFRSIADAWLLSETALEAALDAAHARRLSEALNPDLRPFDPGALTY